MDAGNRRRNAAERSAGRPPRLRIPGLKLTRRTAEPEQDDFLLRALRRLREERIGEET